MSTDRPKAPYSKVIDHPVEFVLKSIQNDLWTDRRGIGLPEMIVAALASKMYGDALAMAMLLELEQDQARRRDEAMYHEQADQQAP